MSGINEFILGDKKSRDFSIIMTKYPPVVFAEREVESLSVAGRSGDLTRDVGRYKNLSIPYECAIFHEGFQTLREAAVAAAALLQPSADYKMLRNTYHPDTYRFARISGQISVESIMEQAGTFTVTFDCKPQRFLVSGEHPITFPAAGTLRNPTMEIAKPLITVYGSSAGTLWIGDYAVEIKAITDQMILDCDSQNAYRKIGEGAPENKNGSIYAPNFPELLPGNSLIRWDGGISKVEIIPRWWTL